MTHQRKQTGLTADFYMVYSGTILHACVSANLTEFIFIVTYIPVNPLPGVETNGSLIDWSMVPSWIAGCMLLITWLHTGNRVTYNLVTGSRSMAQVFADSDEVSRFFVSNFKQQRMHHALCTTRWWNDATHTPFFSGLNNLLPKLSRISSKWART